MKYNLRYLLLGSILISSSLYTAQEVNLRVEITIPSYIEQELHENQRDLAEGLRPFLEPYGLTFTKLDHLHITLVYIDKMPTEKYDALQRALQKAAASIEPINDVYIAEGLTLFGTQPFIIFPLKQSPTLSQAVQVITSELEAQQIPIKKFKTFRPHISLGFVSVQNGRTLLNNIGAHKQIRYQGKPVQVGLDGLTPHIISVCKTIPVAVDEITADAIVVSGAKPLQVSLEKKKQ